MITKSSGLFLIFLRWVERKSLVQCDKINLVDVTRWSASSFSRIPIWLGFHKKRIVLRALLSLWVRDFIIRTRGPNRYIIFVIFAKVLCKSSTFSAVYTFCIIFIFFPLNIIYSKIIIGNILLILFDVNNDKQRFIQFCFKISLIQNDIKHWLDIFGLF